MKLLLSIVLLTITQSTLLSQSSSISTWIKDHPEVIFIESKNSTNFSQEEISQFNQKLIIFENEIKESDIVKYDPNFTEVKLEELTIQSVSNKTQAQDQSIKDWMTENKGIKVVPYSVYKNSDDATRQEYLDKKCLILQSEKVTELDIKNFKF